MKEIPVVFDSGCANKIHNQITAKGSNVTCNTNAHHKSAIAKDGIPANENGEFVFPAKIVHKDGNAHIMIGFTSLATYDSNATSTYPGHGSMTGISLNLANDCYYGVKPGGAQTPYFVDSIKACSEVISQLSIKNNGHSKQIRWIVDGKAGTWVDCAAQLTGDRIYPMINLWTLNDSVEAVSLECLKIRTGDAKDIIEPVKPVVPPTPVLMKEAFSNNFPNQLASTLRGNIVHSVLFGLAGAGKSTVYNFMTYVLYGKKFAGGHRTGEATVVGGQFSTQCVRERSSFLLEKWDVAQNGDLLFTDTVGFKGDESEFQVIGNGKLEEIEAWPRDSSPESNLKRAEILNRAPQTTRPTCFVLFISSDQLMNKNDKANDDIVNSVLDAAKTKFKAGKYQVEIPIIIVVGKVDKYEANPKMEDLLLQRTSPKLAGIFKECQGRFGVAQDDIFALGFMDESDVADFSADTKDPRVLTVRHLLLRIADGARLCAKRFNQYETPASPNQAKNGNDDDEQQKQFAAVAAAYGCANPIVVVAGQGEPNVADVNGVSGAASTVASIAAADAEKQRQIAYFEDQMNKAGSKKAYVETLDNETLNALLLSRNVAKPIAQAIVDGNSTGAEFVDEDFIETVFDDETKKKHNISKMNMTSFIKIRNALIQ